MVWLNRIGIILNFIGGILLAPNLIGEKRLKKAESYLERLLSKFKILMQPWQIKAFVESQNGQVTVEFWFMVIILSIFVIHQLSPQPETTRSNITIPKPYVYLIFAVYMVFWFAHIAYAHVWPAYTHLPMRRRVVTTAYMTLIAPFIVGLYVTVSLILLILWYLWRLILFLWLYIAWQITEFASNRLVGKGQIQAIMVSLGIIFLVVGTLLQLLATF